MISPIHMWLCFVAATAVYHWAKGALGYSPEWGGFFSSLYWFGYGMLVVQFGLVKS